MKSFFATVCAVIGLLIASPIFATPLPTTTGPISVMQFGPSLFIYGNNNDNLIWFGQFPNGDIAVLGLGGANGQTVINGEADNFGRYSGVKNVFINTFGGNDLVIGTNNIFELYECLDFDIFDEIKIGLPEDLANDIYIPGELEIVTGSGYDVVALGGVGTQSNMEVFTDNDRDEVGLCDIYVGSNLLVVTGNDADDVLITGFEFDLLFGDEFVNFVHYNATIDTGFGNDDVCVDNLVTDQGSLVIVTLDGDDDVRLGDCFFGDPEGGSGGDEGFVSVDKDLIVNVGNGTDEVRINNTVVGSNLFALLGNGKDDLLFDGVFVEHLTHVNAGGHNDDVLLFDFDTKWLECFMGNGDDELIIEYSSAWQILADGGTGYDCFYDHAVAYQHEIIFGFESFDCKLK